MIREMKAGDVGRILEIGEIIHRETWYKIYEYDKTKVLKFLADILLNDDAYSKVYEKDGEVVGVMLGWLHDFWFSDERGVSDLVLFVHPEYRGSMAAIRLIKGFMEWAADKGAREVNINITSGVYIERTGKLYERLGFKHVGGCYKYRTGL